MKMLKLFLSIVLFVVVAQGAIYCPPDACHRINCASEPEERCLARGGRYEPKGGQCGCCSNCVHQLDEGENCIKEIIIGAPRREEECGVGLVCDIDDVLCRKRTCAEEKIVAEEKIKSQHPIMGVHIPNCLENGKYHPKQCHEASCFCVSATGERIGDYDIPFWEADDMNCRCAREKYEYNQIGKKFRCDEKGNYEKIQCQGSMCFCADESGKQRPDIESVPIHQKGLLEGKCDALHF